VKLTAAMVTWNSRTTLWRALTSLAKQKVPVSLMLCDSGSTDETDWWMGTKRFGDDLAKLGLTTMRILPPIPSKVGVFEGAELTNKHLEHALAKVAWENSQTPPDGLLWHHPDVVATEGALSRMVEVMEAEPRLGGIGLEIEDVDGVYQPVDHVRMSFTLYRWEPFAQLAEMGFFSNGCPCRWTHRMMEKNGWEVRNLEGVRATHLAEGGSHGV
jgi:hypothetical protein